MNRSNEARNDDYSLVMRKRSQMPKNVDFRIPRSTYMTARNMNPDRMLFKGSEDMAPFNDQLVQYNILKPYKSPVPGVWKTQHYA